MGPGKFQAVIAGSLFLVIVGSSTAFLITQIPKDPFIPPAKATLELPKPEAALDPTVYSVPFCELLRDPDRYHKKLIRTQAIFVNGVDWFSIRSDQCSDQNGTVAAVGAVEANDKLIESASSDQIGPMIKELLRQDYYDVEVHADMVGRFYAGAKTGRGHEFAVLYEFTARPIGKRL